MNIWDSDTYLSDVEKNARLPFPWERLAGKTVLLSGVTGMIGSFLTDVLQYKNRADALDCTVWGLGRSERKARERFAAYWGSPRFRFSQCDINVPLTLPPERADFVFHLASNTHPAAYATDPVGTVTANIIGLKNLLDFAVASEAERVLFASSCEVYGENRGDTDYFREDYCGYIDCNTLRAGYPESKRAGEALCQAYIRRYGLDIVIPRLSRTFGPTMLQSDTKAISQFIKKAAAGEDIVLKSDGMQLYSYTYVADAVSGLLACLLWGKSGQAYNIADKRCDIRLKDLAELIAGLCGRKVVFELPDETEKAGYSTATKALLDSSKLRALGWSAQYDIAGAVAATLDALSKGHRP